MSDLERSLCGAICIDPAAVLPLVTGIVSAADFEDERCAVLFDAATESMSRGKPLDAVLISNAIAPSYTTQQEAEAFVRECMEICPTLANAEIHARTVHENGRDRQARDMVNRLTCSGLRGEELISALMEESRGFLEQGNGARIRRVGEIVGDLYSEQGKKDDRRIDTGFPKLDSILQGMTAGNLVLMAARPSVGKSAFAGEIALTVARSGRPVLFVTMEMDEREVAHRLMARASAVPLGTFANGNAGAEEWRTLAHGCSALSNCPLYICDKSSMTVARIRSTAWAIPQLALIIVDYIGLMQPTHRNDSRNLEMGALSRELKNLAAELRIPILALAQLNRMATDNERPGLHHLRDSGELEQNANKVIFLWNEEKAAGVVGVSVAKNRSGGTGETYMRFDGEHMTYLELSDYTPAPPRKQGRGIGLDC